MFYMNRGDIHNYIIIYLMNYIKLILTDKDLEQEIERKKQYNYIKLKN